MKMQRDSKGRFKKRSSTGNRSSSRRSSESRRSSPASAARETRRAPSHRSSPRRKSSARSYESKPRKSSSHRSSTRRSSSRKPTQTNIAIVPVGAMREASRRSASPRRYRARDGSRTVVSMTAGGITLLFVSASVGFIVADVLDRYIAGVDPAASPAPTLPAPYATVDNPIPKYNNDAQAMQPGWGRMGAQFALGLFGIALGAALKTPALKFTFYGLGLGAMTHLSAQIVTAYIIVPMSKSSTGAGARMYQHEINVYNGLANPSGGILGKGPAQLGAPAQQTKRNDAPPQLPANQPQGRMPAALASQATRQEVPVGTPAASPPARAAAPAAAPAPAPAAAASPATMGQPPAHQSGCGCQQCKPAEQPSNGGTGAHPMFSYKFRHAIGAQRRAA